MTFELLPQLAKKKYICDLPLSAVLMENARDMPWVFLVPRRSSIVELHDLTCDDQVQLIKEMAYVSGAMKKLFHCDKINVGMIGNKTPQLHVHVICRMQDDKYWPETVWQYKSEAMSDEECAKRIEQLREMLKNFS